MTTSSPYNSQGWRARQARAAARKAHQDKMADHRAERARLYAEQAKALEAPVTVEAPAPEVPAEATETVPASVAEPAPTEAAGEAPVAAETDADVQADTPAAPTKGRKKG